LLAKKIYIMHQPVHISIMCMYNTYLVISEKGMYFARKVFDRVAISRRHMVRGIRAIWKRIACIVPNSKVGTPTFQLVLSCPGSWISIEKNELLFRKKKTLIRRWNRFGWRSLKESCSVVESNHLQ
jgi:hypothetical protein